MDGGIGCNKDEEVTLLFDDNGYVTSSRHILEAVSPAFEVALNDFQHDGSLRMPRTSAKAWTFILQCIESNDPAADISNEIEQLSDDAIIDVLKQSHKYGIISLERKIDEHIAGYYDIADTSWRSNTDYILIRLQDRGFAVLRGINIARTEAAVAKFLIRVLKENEKRYKQRISNERSVNSREFQIAVQRINSLLKQMCHAGRFRLLYLFTVDLLEDRSAMSRAFRHIRASDTRYRWRDLSAVPVNPTTTTFVLLQKSVAMSSPDGQRKLDGESAIDKNDDITFLFEDDTSLKCSRRVLEAASPVLERALRDCEHNGSLRLPQTSTEVWTFILQHIESNDPSADISDEIDKLSDDAIIEVLKQCQGYKIESLKRKIDEHIAKDFEAVVASDESTKGFIFVDSGQRGCRALEDVNLPRTEAAVARYLIRALKKNEARFKRLLSEGRNAPGTMFRFSLLSFYTFLEDMCYGQCHRLLYLFAHKLMEDRFVIPSEALRQRREIASRIRSMRDVLKFTFYFQN